MFMYIFVAGVFTVVADAARHFNGMTECRTALNSGIETIPIPMIAVL